MTDPPRLLDDSPNDVEAALLQAGRDYRAPSGTHAKTLAALGVAGSSALVTGSSAAAMLPSIKTLLVGGAIVGVAAVGVAVAVAPQSPSEQTASAVSSTNTAPAPVSAKPPSPAPRQGNVEDAEAVEAEPGAAASARPRSPAKSSKRRTTSITAELEAIDAARSALAAGNGARALALLDDHARQFPKGRLHLEAEVLRIEALARSGQRAAAARRAKAFVERYPNSVFTPRVRRFAAE